MVRSGRRGEGGEGRRRGGRGVICNLIVIDLSHTSPHPHTSHTSHPYLTPTCLTSHLTQTDGLVSDYSNLPSNITASGEFVYENPFLMSTTLQSTTIRSNTYDNAPQHANYDNTNVLETDVMTMVGVGIHLPPSSSPSSLPPSLCLSISSLSLSSVSLFLFPLPFPFHHS